MIKVVAANLNGNKEVTLLSGDEVGRSAILFYKELLSGWTFRTGLDGSPLLLLTTYIFPLAVLPALGVGCVPIFFYGSFFNSKDALHLEDETQKDNKAKSYNEYP